MGSAAFEIEVLRLYPFATGLPSEFMLRGDEAEWIARQVRPYIEAGEAVRRIVIAVTEGADYEVGKWHDCDGELGVELRRIDDV